MSSCYGCRQKEANPRNGVRIPVPGFKMIGEGFWVTLCDVCYERVLAQVEGRAPRPAKRPSDRPIVFDEYS